MGRVNKKNVNIANLEKLLKTFGRKISVRVGVLGEAAYQKADGTDLTNAQLAAVHEYGTTINHPGGTPYLIKEDGTAQFVSKEKGEKLPKTKPHEIIEPTRSFLRMPILSPEGKRAIRKQVQEKLKKSGIELSNDMMLNKEAFKKDEEITFILNAVASWVGEAAYDRVIGAFETDGYGKWKPTKPSSKKRREYNETAPTLVDRGNQNGLKGNISYDITES